MRELLPTKELVIKNKEWEGYSLWKYIKHLYPYYTKLLVIKELRLKRILVNNTTSYFQYKLMLGDSISIVVLPSKRVIRSKKNIYSNTTRELNKLRNSQILFENEHLIIVFKQYGQTVQTNNYKTISLSELIKKHSANSSNYTSKFVHRLDRPVSGLLVCAKNANAHRILSEALKKRELTKLYQAIVIGNCNFKSQKLIHWIDDRGTRVKIHEEASPEFKYSEAVVSKLRSLSKLSLVELKLVTGRKNQLRAQLAYINLPILGDRKYYSESIKSTLKNIKNTKLNFNPNKIALVAYKLVFPPYLVKALNLPWTSFTLPNEKNIILKSLQLN